MRSVVGGRTARGCLPNLLVGVLRSAAGFFTNTRWERSFRLIR